MKNRLLLAVLLCPLFLFSKEYEITDVQILAQLNTDGSMDVSESRTYRFKDSFTFAFINLSKSKEISRIIIN